MPSVEQNIDPQAPSGSQTHLPTNMTTNLKDMPTSQQFSRLAGPKPVTQLVQAPPSAQSRVEHVVRPEGGAATSNVKDAVALLSSSEQHCASQKSYPTPSFRSLKGRPICLLLGTEKREYYIHTDLLIGSSAFFSKMLTGDWREAQTGIVRLNDVAVHVFEAYQQFLYFREVASNFALAKESQTDAEYERLVDCYALGDRFQDVAFKNAVMDAIVINSCTPVHGYYVYPSGHVTSKIYKSTSSGSVLGKLVVDQHVAHGEVSWMLEPGFSTFDPQFLFDLSVAFMTGQATGSKMKKGDDEETCRYHEHSTNEKGCTKHA